MAISYSEIENILKMALTAPSGDNAQPWRFTWNDNTLAIFCDVSLGRHALNNADHATWLSFGCFIEALTIGASGFKFQISAEYDFEYILSRPLAIVKFSRGNMKPDHLISEIMRRQTYRGKMLSEPLPENISDFLRMFI